MAKFKLTPLSVADVEAITDFTLRTWGRNQCERYLGDLQACFQELADHPDLGRNCDELRPGLMRMGLGRHVVFYRRSDYGIRILRVLHQKMLPGLHGLDKGNN